MFVTLDWTGIKKMALARIRMSQLVGRAYKAPPITLTYFTCITGKVNNV